MKYYNILLFICSFVLPYAYTASIPAEGKNGDKSLFLTPYIESGKVEEGRKLAEVKSFLGDVKSYSGLLTVDKRYDSNLFFWYFPSESKASTVPLLVWLNGFSTASTYGVFLQTGPYNLLEKPMTGRETSWQKYYNVVYFDSPVGVGFSYTNSSEGYSTDLDQVSTNLHNALEQFLKLFPDLSGRELYLTGLSLGGKYIPGFAHKIYNIDSLNLKGIFVGNPLLDFERQMTFENYLYELGFIDKNQQKELIKEQDRLINLMKSPNDMGKFYDDSLVFWLTSDSYLVNITGLDNIFDYDDNVVESKHYYEFIQSDKTKAALHVTGTPYNDGTETMKLFVKGIIFSTLGYIEEMANAGKPKMMFYAGQTDVSCAYPMMVEALMSMNWTGKADYTAAPRERLYKDDGHHIWGYLRNQGPLTDVMIRKAGHSAVTSQPEQVLWLLKKFTDYRRF